MNLANPVNLVNPVNSMNLVNLVTVWIAPCIQRSAEGNE